MFRRILTAACISISIWGCSSENSQGKEGSITIGSFQSPCYGVSQQLCMRAKLNNSGDFELFYGYIEGFDYKWGTSYKVRVKITDIDNPPADSSSEKYQLIETSSSLEDQVGTFYDFNGVEMLDSTFTKVDGDYYFLGKDFKCASGTDCDVLISLNNSGGLVNVMFEYLGNGKIQLVSWS